MLHCDMCKKVQTFYNLEHCAFIIGGKALLAYK